MVLLRGMMVLLPDQLKMKMNHYNSNLGQLDMQQYYFLSQYSTPDQLNSHDMCDPSLIVFNSPSTVQKVKVSSET